MTYLAQHNGIGIRKMTDTEADYALMAQWLSKPEVLDYYGGRSKPFDLAAIKKKYEPRVRGLGSVKPCMIEYDQEAIGFIQFYPIDPVEYNAVGIISLENDDTPFGLDLFIGQPNLWNKGFGTSAIQLMIDYLFKTGQAKTIYIDPVTSNTRAIRSYEKCGFQAVQILEKRELCEGEYMDNLLMVIRREDCRHKLTRED